MIPISADSSTPDRPVIWATAILGFVIVNFLVGYKQGWAVGAFSVGLVLGIGLWYVNCLFVRAYLVPQKSSTKPPKKRAMTLFALVKSPLVAVIIWALVRLGETKHLIAFVGGYLILQVVVVIRSMSAALKISR